MINPIFAREKGREGRLNARLRLGGNEKSAAVRPDAAERWDIDGNFMPFDMQPSQLAMNQRHALDPAGTVNTRQGQIALSAVTPTGRRSITGGQIAAKGSRVRITVPPMVRLDVSPDGCLPPRQACLISTAKWMCPGRGSVNEVPESAVGVSSDEVMLDKNLAD